MGCRVASMHRHTRVCGCLQGAAQIVEAASRGSPAKQNSDAGWFIRYPILDSGHGSEARSRGTYILSHASLVLPFESITAFTANGVEP